MRLAPFRPARTTDHHRWVGNGDTGLVAQASCALRAAPPEQEAELLAAVAKGAAAAYGPQPRPCHAQHLVTDVVAEAVVDRFEMIDVHHGYGKAGRQGTQG